MFDTNVHSNTPVPFPPPQGRQAVTQQTIAAVSGQQVEQQEEFMMTQAKTYLTGGAFDKEVSEFRANANLRTGYKTLDRIQPFYPGVYCIGAIPSLGKTTFSAQMADQVAETGRPVLYFSLEQTAFELYSKSLARGFFKTCERQRRANNALNGSYPSLPLCRPPAYGRCVAGRIVPLAVGKVDAFSANLHGNAPVPIPVGPVPRLELPIHGNHAALGEILADELAHAAPGGDIEEVGFPFAALGDVVALVSDAERAYGDAALGVP